MLHLFSDEWFDNVFFESVFLWTAAHVAVDKMYRNNNLRKKSLHIVRLPCLMISVRKGKLAKVVDGLLSIPFDEKVWPQTNLEKIILVIVFHFVHLRPWKLQGTHLVVECKQDIQEVWDK